MKLMKSWTVAPVLLGFTLTVTAPAFSQQQKGSAQRVAKSVLPDSTPPVAAVKPVPRKRSINADLAYKANCSRCHAAPRKFSDRVMATVMRHMRVRANLTQEETKAILHYLTE